MAEDRAIYRAIAVRGAWIVAVSANPHGLDQLIVPGWTRIVDDPALTVLPALYDTHLHLLEAARNMTLVSLDQARSIADCIALIRQRAAQTPPGDWIRTTNSWNEAALAEHRLPTRAELDEATRDHPVFVRRGGHLAIANSLALQRAGITSATPNPPGGTIGHLPDGTPNGVVEGGMVYVVMALIPPQSFAEQVDGLQRACQVFTGLGLGAARDPLIQRDELLIYQAAWERGALGLRCRLMVVVAPTGSVADRIALVEGLGVRSGFGGDGLRLWGLKMVMDGGVEGAALDAPNGGGGEAAAGHLNWNSDEMVAVVNAAVRRGWRIGTHAAGDRALRTLLDVYERVIADNPGLPPDTLVVEHALLANAVQRARAIRLGIPITVQHPLLYTLGRQMVEHWGVERAEAALPVHSWLDEGAALSAGSDYPAGSYDVTRSVWGLVTRRTEGAGVLGAREAIDQYTALRLYTAAGAQLDRESGRRGTLQAGRLADLVAFGADPVTCPTDDLLALRPVFTVVGGRPVYDPAGRLA
jgi:predicted amidohydrolase YtcJ